MIKCQSSRVYSLLPSAPPTAQSPVLPELPYFWSVAAAAMSADWAKLFCMESMNINIHIWNEMIHISHPDSEMASTLKKIRTEALSSISKHV